MKSIKPEVYNFEVGSKRFLFDISKSMFFEIDSLAKEVLNLAPHYEENQLVNILADRHKRKDVLAVLREWREFKKWGFFQPKNDNEVLAEYKVPLFQLFLSASHGCNLSCRYCYSENKADWDYKQRMMSEDIARKSVDFVISEFAEKVNSLHIWLVGEGEPLMNFGLFKSLKKYCKRKEEKYKKKIYFLIGTNGTLFNEEILQYLNTEDQNQRISISIDGDRMVHNRMRIFKDGRGSYEVIRPWIERITSSGEFTSELRNTWASVVITGMTKNITEILKHLRELNFRRVQMKPVRAPRDKFFAITEENIKNIKKIYTDFTQFLIETALDDNLEYIKMILNRYDFLGRFIIRVLTGSKMTYRCRAGKNMVSVAANGDIYPCDSFVGNTEFRLGNVKTGWHKNKRKLFFDLHVAKKKICNTCWARYLCGGGCYYSAYLCNGRLDKPDPVNCQLVKHLIKLSLLFTTSVSEKNPGAFKKIYRLARFKDRGTFL